MTEKINGQGFRPTDTVGTRRAEGPKSGAGNAHASTDPASHGDTVNLTRSGLLLSKLEESLQTLAVVNSDRVRAFKEAIASGDYEIDNQAVADKMIRLDRELLG